MFHNINYRPVHKLQKMLRGKGTITIKEFNRIGLQNFGESKYYADINWIFSSCRLFICFIVLTEKLVAVVATGNRTQRGSVKYL